MRYIASRSTVDDPIPLVMIVLTRMAAGAPPQHVVTLARRLPTKGFRTILVFGSCEPSERDASETFTGSWRRIRVRFLHRSVHLWHDLRATLELVRLMHTLKPALVHTHTAKAGCLGRLAAAIAGVPGIVHTYHGNVLSEYFSTVVSRAFQAVERSLAIITTKSCVLSDQQRAEMIGRLGARCLSKVEVVPLGVPLHEFEAIPARSPSSRQCTIGWFGGYVPIKDIDLLVSVILQAHRDGLSVRFVVAGDGEEMWKVREPPQRSGRERLESLGWQTDIRPLLARCDLLILTSKNEGTPATLLQGMAAGRPFIATAVGGVRDMAGRVMRTTAGVEWGGGRRARSSYDGGLLLRYTGVSHAAGAGK